MKDIKYIVGIDFGHGETTANYIEIYDKENKNYSDSRPLPLKKGSKKIRSFFCRYRSYETERFYQKGVDNFNNNNYQEACENFRSAVDAFLAFQNLQNVKGISLFDDACASRHTNNDNYEESAKDYKQLIENAWIYDLDPQDNNISNYIRKHAKDDWVVEFHHSFKVPINSDRYQEQIFGKFVNCVYKKIIENNDTQTTVKLEVNEDMSPKNFLLYAACPSGWSDDQRESFRTFLIDNGVLCEKVFKESDAAWVTYIPPKIGDLDNPKMLVIDYGSSTIDLTWSEDTRKDICNPNELGASKVESLVFDYLVGEGKFEDDNGDEIAKEEYEKVKNFLKDDIFAKEIIKLSVRKEKENFYSEILDYPDNNDIEFRGCVLSNIFPRDENLGNLGYFGDSLNVNIVNTKILESYMNDVEDYFRNFRRNHMENTGGYNKPRTIILTGGASRMKFVKELVKKVFEIEPNIDEDRASESISSGVALAGARDFLSGNIELPDPDPDGFKIENIKLDIQNIVNDKIQAHILGLLNAKFDSWQNGCIGMDIKHNLNTELVSIAKDMSENEFDLWWWVDNNVTNGREFNNGNRSIHALFYAIMDSVKGVNNEMDNVLYNVTQSIVDYYNNKIKLDIVPSLLNYVKIYAPLTTEADLEKLITLKLERINAVVEISNEVLTQFLTILVETAYQTIENNDFWGIYERTLNKDRNDSYRNGYFNDLRNDFETFSKTIEAKILNIDKIANSISNSIENKMNEIQNYCTTIGI